MQVGDSLRGVLGTIPGPAFSATPPPPYPTAGPAEMRIKKFLLFTAPAAGDRKTFVGSFESREEAIAAAGRLKEGGGLWWQVIETATAECVAQDPGWTTPFKPSTASEGPGP